MRQVDTDGGLLYNNQGGKVGKALVLAIVAVAVGMLVFWLARPRTVSPDATRTGSSRHGELNDSGLDHSGSASSPESGAGAGKAGGGANSDSATRTPASVGPIEPPRTEQQKERDAIESRRMTLYGRLHQDLGAEVVAIRPSDDDAATLDLYAARDVSTLALLSVALRANIAYYGFRHIRFFAPNPPQSIEKFRLDAEASADAAGNWQTFKK